MRGESGTIPLSPRFFVWIRMMLNRLKSNGQKLKRELKVYQLVLKDSRTPLPAKLFLGAAIGYFLLPFDLVPDVIPVLGQLDDVLIVPTLLILALKFTPPEIIEDCRNQIIDREAVLNQEKSA
jgi:uncharacterized membrane protein YkvA (DUF1232 family)